MKLKVSGGRVGASRGGFPSRTEGAAAVPSAKHICR